MEGKKFCEAFAPVEKERLKRVTKLKPDKADSFPSFTMGAGDDNTEEIQAEDALAPEELEKSKSDKLSPTEQLANILHIEQLKERINNPEYIPVSFDMAQMVAEDRNVYVANLTEYMDEKAEVVRCMTIDKSDAHVSEDGMRLLAYLKKSGESNIMEYNGEGQKLREFKVKNEKLAGDVLKGQMERSKTEKIPIQEIGKEIVRTEVQFKPATLLVKRIVRQVAKCMVCGSNENDRPKHIQKASVPAKVLPHSIATHSLVAQIMYQKFGMGLPFARQEKDFYRMGLVLSRANMAHWTIRCSDEWLMPVYDRIHQELIQKCEILHMDETRIQVNT